MSVGVNYMRDPDTAERLLEPEPEPALGHRGVPEAVVEWFAERVVAGDHRGDRADDLFLFRSGE